MRASICAWAVAVARTAMIKQADSRTNFDGMGTP
jgi:hypothetical protein